MVSRTSISLSIFILLITYVSCNAVRQFEFEWVSSVAASDQTYNQDTAEIPAYDPETGFLYVANSGKHRVDVFNIFDIVNPTFLGSLDLSSYGDQVPSVAVHDSVLAVSVGAFDVTNNGKVLLCDISSYPPVIVQTVIVGALPDNILFSPDGKKIVVANEGEPNLDYTVDPEGSISVIRLLKNNNKEVKFSVDAIKNIVASVTNINFHAFNSKIGEYQAPGSSIRIFGKGASVSQDLEPEYLAISDDSKEAWVVLQENNAIAHIDLQNNVVTDITGLGYKDARLAQNSFDGCELDQLAKLSNWPVSLMYQPDEAYYFRMNSHNYIFIANEGDKRDYFNAVANYNEVVKVKDLTLDPHVFPDPAYIKNTANGIGNLRVSKPVYSDPDRDGDVDVLYSFGGRSVSVYDVDAHKIIYDSANEIETFLAAEDPAHFNSRDDNNLSMDGRSGVAGCEPEGVEKGIIDGFTYFFVTLDKQGGVFMFEVQDPAKPEMKAYINHRIWSQTVSQANIGKVGDLGPEGLVFISKNDNPDKNNLLV